MRSELGQVLMNTHGWGYDSILPHIMIIRGIKTLSTIKVSSKAQSMTTMLLCLTSMLVPIEDFTFCQYSRLWQRRFVGMGFIVPRHWQTYVGGIVTQRRLVHILRT